MLKMQHIKKNKFDKCDIISGNDLDCEDLKDDVIEFDNEVKNIFNNYKINPLFLTI